MTQDEIDNFDIATVTRTGTIIIYPYNKIFHDAIVENFNTPEERGTSIQLNDLIPVVFGRFPDTKIQYKDWENPSETKTIKPYNYFGGTDNEYYGGKMNETIEHFHRASDNHSRYIWSNGGVEFEIPKDKRTVNKYGKTAKKRTTDLGGYELIGEYTVIAGQRIDLSIFDHTNPLTPENLECSNRYSWEQNALHTEYDKEHIIPTLNLKWLEWLSEFPLVRNNQQIGRFKCPDYQSTSSRGSAEAHHSYFGVRAELRYSPVSNHNNKQDKIMNIQMNKNQWVGDDIDINLSRLVKDIRKKKAKEIWENWLTPSLAAHPEPGPGVAPSKLRSDYEALAATFFLAHPDHKDAAKWREKHPEPEPEAPPEAPPEALLEAPPEAPPEALLEAPPEAPPEAAASDFEMPPVVTPAEALHVVEEEIQPTPEPPTESDTETETESETDEGMGGVVQAVKAYDRLINPSLTLKGVKDKLLEQVAQLGENPDNKQLVSCKPLYDLIALLKKQNL
tara:strand:- start:64 stop:1578 length:1515 start_codon:yes stop_codon:yes gene_type:complete